ncbi:MAG: DUF255 domain-containing protein [Pedobacter sp.]|nr:MAG: DUF255 domain-containing protein [Pedobacter sp.]
MKKFLLTIIMLVLLTPSSFAIDFFSGTYQEALQKAKEEKKPIFLYFTAVWCGPCQYMQKYIFPDGALSAFVTKNYIALKLDIDTQEGKLIYYKSHQPRGPVGVPAFIIMNEKEEILKKGVGGMKIEQLRSFLIRDDGEKVIYNALADSIAINQIKADVSKPTALGKLFFNARASDWKPGLKLGANLMNLAGSWAGDKRIMGYEIGFFFDYNTKYKSDKKRGFWDWSRYHFQPGLLLNSMAGEMDINDQMHRLNVHYLTLELFNGYQIRGLSGLELTFSPYASLGLWGNTKTVTSLQKVNFRDDFSRSNYGLKMGIGKQYGTFQANLGYNLGLKDITNFVNSKSVHRGFYFSIGMTVGK